MDSELRKRLESFVGPLYQDLDGASRVADVDRVGRIARRLYQPATPEDARSFELLLLFHRLGGWLARVGNISRTVLAVGGIEEAELRRTTASARRLDAPETEPERAVAAALLIDEAGVRGLTEHFSRARREGSSMMDVIRAALAEVDNPLWLPEQAAQWLHARREARREVCRRLLEESALDDLR